jgi:hypothetical protein
MSTPHQALLDKIKQLPPQRMAEVENFVDFLRSREDERRLVSAAAEASAPSFAQVWNNDEDAAFEQPHSKAAKVRRAGPAARPTDSAQPNLKGRFQGRAKAPLGIRDMDDAIAAAVVEAHNRISRRVK